MTENGTAPHLTCAHAQIEDDFLYCDPRRESVRGDLAIKAMCFGCQNYLADPEKELKMRKEQVHVSVKCIA